MEDERGRGRAWSLVAVAAVAIVAVAGTALAMAGPAEVSVHHVTGSSAQVRDYWTPKRQ